MTVTATQITGAHPYTEKYPMLTDDQLQEMAESIRENGLRQPIVLTPDGLILDGRNRYAACQKVGVDPETVVYDGDDLREYVIDANKRRNITDSQRAMCEALVYVADGTATGNPARENGRWKRGMVGIDNDVNISWRSRLREAGVILDYAPDLAEQVSSGALHLSAAFKQAERVRDEERGRLGQEERIKAEEAEALATLPPEYRNRIGTDFQSARVALAAWEDDNRAEAAKRRRAKELAEKKARDHKEAMVDFYTGHMSKALSILGGYGARPDPLSVMDEFSRDYLRPPTVEAFFTRENILNARRFLDALLEWKDSK